MRQGTRLNEHCMTAVNAKHSSHVGGIPAYQGGPGIILAYRLGRQLT